MTKNLARALKELLKLDGVIAAVAVKDDGMVIEFVSTVDRDAEALAALAAMAVGAADSLGAELELGSITQYLAEFDNGKVLVAKAGDKLIAVITDSDAIIGAVRYELSRIVPRVAQV